MEFKSIDSLSIAECCEHLGIRTQDLPEVLNTLNLSDEKEKQIAQRLKKLLEAGNTNDLHDSKPSSAFIAKEDGTVTREFIDNSKEHPNVLEFIPLSAVKIKGNRALLWIFIPFMLGIPLLGIGGTMALIFEGLDYEVAGLVILGIIVGIATICIELILWKQCRNTMFINMKKYIGHFDYIQSNLEAYNRHPIIMYRNLIGIYDTKRRKILLHPNFDTIKWIIPYSVIAASRNGKKSFYDNNGNLLKDVPESYYHL